MKYINSTLSYFYRLLFPLSCIGCKAKNTAFCPRCFKKLRRALPIPLENTMALYPYKDVFIKQTLWEAKYHHHTKPLEYLVRHSISDIFEFISSYTLSEENIQLIFIPIPTSTERRKARGYNVPTIIAQTLARESGGTYIDALIKTRDTIPQSKTRSREVRLHNVRNSLALKNTVQLPQNGLIVLVDDIITSGATAQEARRACREAGYEALVIALAHGS